MSLFINVFKRQTDTQVPKEKNRLNKNFFQIKDVLSKTSRLQDRNKEESESLVKY